jgi:hypothetical protein
VRTIRARLHVGQARAQRLRAYLATLACSQQVGLSSNTRLTSQAPSRAPDRTARQTDTAKYPPIWTPGLVASVTAVQRQNALICAAVFMANMLAGFRLCRMAGVAVR